ncbi:DsbA family protein [Neptuniibacter sp. PT34_22]|uniref:DsbA family protein n=1 Tax=Neptuniibacter sp. PT34_22 TaxID=3398205 RepID=UPI0039F563DC
MNKFIYVMDPMCSWCWAFSPVISHLKDKYPELQWQLLMGGLAPDSDAPMPEVMQQKLISIWQHIEEHTGTKFNFDFWSENTPRRSTYPACRAVIAAEQLESDSAFDMIEAIQQAYYQKALNPSDIEVLTNLAEGIGLNKDRFDSLMTGQEIQTELEQQIQQSHALGAQGFPSLFIATEAGAHAISYGYCGIEEVTRRIEAILGR